MNVRSTRRRSKTSAGDRGTKRRAEQAKRRAYRRLASVFPDLFDAFYADERARVGLEPWPVDSIVGRPGSIDAQQTLDFARVYHLLTEHGVDVDGAEIQNENAEPSGQ